MKFILLQNENYFNKKKKQHMKFATTLANTSTCGGIEALKLEFLRQVTYKINQINIQLQLKKFMQRKTNATRLWEASIICQYHGNKGVWIVNQLLNLIDRKTQTKKIMSL
jgi:ligand-binding sensor protein